MYKLQIRNPETGVEEHDAENVTQIFAKLSDSDSSDEFRVIDADTRAPVLVVRDRDLFAAIVLEIAAASGNNQAALSEAKAAAEAKAESRAKAKAEAAARAEAEALAAAQAQAEAEALIVAREGQFEN